METQPKNQKSDYRVQGGTMPITATTYVPRQCDQELYEFSKSGDPNNRLCSILAPRQMGKSSLMARTAYRLSQDNLIGIQINLQQLGKPESDEQFWYSLLEEICRQFDDFIEHKNSIQNGSNQINFKTINFTEKLDDAWTIKPDRSAAKRFTSFLTDEILANTNAEKLIIFLDEIQNLMFWGMQNHFIGYLKAISENVHTEALKRLCFVILGVAKTSDFITDSGVVLNLGKNIEIGTLTGECKPLTLGLQQITDQPQTVINSILKWTGGQPFLTQVVCHLLVKQGKVNDQVDWESYVAQSIENQIIINWRNQDHHHHLQEIENSLTRRNNIDKIEKTQALDTYKFILSNGKIYWDEQNQTHWNLLISGLVRKSITQEGIYLQVANPIYEQVFNEDWMRRIQETMSEKNQQENPDNPYKSMSRAKQIEDIIKQRSPRVEKIRVVENNLNVIADALSGLEKRRQQLIVEVQDPNISDRLKKMDFYPIRDQVRRERDSLEKLRLRLSRDTLNLGVVGLMGQGKSTFLQTISGLTNDVIPALRGGACTAVRSTICHQEGETYADVSVHSQESFLKEVIAPYYQELSLGDAPQTLDDFARSLPDFSGGDATLASMYEHLKRDYHDPLPQYRHLLQSGSPRKLQQVPKEQIYQYVSQPRNDQGDLKTFDHLVVREVKIFCPFPNQEVGKIALVDVPGLGDTRLGDEQLILETLGQEVDLVLFVRRPDPLRYGWEKRDTDLYKTAYQALNNLENRSFMILNHVSGNNDDNWSACQKHQATIADKHINVFQCEIANCSNPNEANKILDLVLDYLASNITLLDNQYALIYQERLNQLQREVAAELDKARQNWTAQQPLDDVNDQGKFLRLFDQLWENLTWKLEELLYAVDQEQKLSQEENDEFKQQVALVIKKCKEDTGIPQDNPVTQQTAVEQIMRRKAALLDWPTTYARYLHDTRTHLTRNFEGMDNGLKKSVEQAKSRLTDLLVEQVHLGNLPRLANVRGDEFLKVMVEIIPDGLPRLKEAFQTFSNFEMSYRANFRSLIRPLLNNLNPNRTDTALSPITGIETPEVRTKMAEEILSCLEVLQGEAVYRCEQALPEIYSEPRKTIFIEVEEFVDQVLRAKDVKNEWQVFLYQERAFIWPAEYGQNREGLDRIEWLKLVEQATQVNQPQKMQFLN